LEACLGSVSRIICITLPYLKQRRSLWPVAGGHLFLSAASEGKKQPPPRYFYQPTHHHHHQPVFHIQLYHSESGIYYQQPTKPRDSVRRKSRLTGTVIIYLVLQQAHLNIALHLSPTASCTRYDDDGACHCLLPFRARVGIASCRAVAPGAGIAAAK
jgi:hypothetical protein